MDKEYIDREATIEKIKQVYCSDCNSYNGVMCRACQIDDAILQIDAEPAADVAPVVHGEWLLGQSGATYSCSVCGYVAMPREAREWEFCPKCGKAMVIGGMKQDEEVED